MGTPALANNLSYSKSNLTMNNFVHKEEFSLLKFPSRRISSSETMNKHGGTFSKDVLCSPDIRGSFKSCDDSNAFDVSLGNVPQYTIDFKSFLTNS